MLNVVLVKYLFPAMAILPSVAFLIVYQYLSVVLPVLSQRDAALRKTHSVRRRGGSG